ncbi:MAG TPA: ectoine/hydroxyectoine ABC transporter permease subunit EhuD [Streptosporangiaceae bacterium]|nr:ectoine/hydroxyectoine ABC transporter permease subunit EhuD [Streptosporangiaceae bacterium]
MQWSWSTAFSDVPLLLKGLVVTFEATVLGSVFAFIVGLLLTLLRRSRIPLLSQVTWAFVEFVRATPLLVQLYFVYFVFPPLLGIKMSALATGVVTLGIHYAAYTSDSYRAGIDGVPRGQWEAAAALSLPRRRVWVSIVLPQAIRRALPALGNYLISMFKDTPLLLTIGVLEMVGQAEQAGSLNYSYVEPITIAGFFFLALSYPSSILVRRLERRVGRQ